MRIVFVLLITCLVVSCQSNVPKKPKNLIPKEDMIMVLQDIALVNAAKSVGKKIVEENEIMPVEFVYKKHNIDSAQFALSNTYYTHNIKEYKKMYIQVESNLKKMQEAFKLEEKKEIKKDSIIKANKKSPIKKKK